MYRLGTWRLGNYKGHRRSEVLDLCRSSSAVEGSTYLIRITDHCVLEGESWLYKDTRVALERQIVQLILDRGGKAVRRLDECIFLLGQLLNLSVYQNLLEGLLKHSSPVSPQDFLSQEFWEMGDRESVFLTSSQVTPTLLILRPPCAARTTEVPYCNVPVRGSGEEEERQPDLGYI